MKNPKILLNKRPKPTASRYRSQCKTVLPYPGGKTLAVPFMVPVLIQALRKTRRNEIVSPFLGGGSIELACQAEGISIYGHDADDNLICFYKYLLNDRAALATAIEDMIKAGVNDNTACFDMLQKSVPSMDHGLGKAAGYFAVKKMSYSGLGFNGGISAMRRLKHCHATKIANFSAPRLDVSFADFKTALRMHSSSMLAYLDPPYACLRKNQRGYYGVNGSLHKDFDHTGLYDLLRERPNWVMSYNSSPAILRRYKGFPMAFPEWRYSMGKNQRSKEVVIFSKDHADLAVWAQDHFDHLKAANDNARVNRDSKAAGLTTTGRRSSVLTKVGQADLPTLHVVPAANDNTPITQTTSPPPISMAGDWPNPDMSVCSDTIKPAPTFPSGVLGNDWETWCTEVAKGANAHFDYVAMALITAATGLVGNSVTVQGNANFIQPSVLWTCCVGKSGSGKTPAMNAISDIVDELDRSQQSRMRLRDTTVAAAVKMAAQTPKGLLVFRDELSGWWSNMKRLGGEDFWLEAFNGKPYSKDRKSDAPIFIENLSISVIGGAQPSTVKDITTDNKNRGFSSRWIFAYPDPIEGYDGGAANPDIEWATNALRRLIDLQVGEASIPFSPEAQTIFREWWDAKMKENSDEEGMWADWMLKQGGNALRIALTLELLKWCAGDEPDLPEEIATETVEDALRLIVEWAIPMAQRTLEVMGRSPSDLYAAALVRFLKREKMAVFNARRLRRGEYGQPGALSATKAMDEACRALVEAGLIRHVGVRNHAHKGRAATDYETHPILLGEQIGNAK